MKKSVKLLITTLLLMSLLATVLVCFTACDEPTEGYLPTETYKVYLNRNSTKLNDIPLGMLFKSESYIQITPEGEFEARLMIVDIAELAGNEMIAGALAGLDLSSITKSYLKTNFVDGYVNVMFPGFDMKDLAGSLDLVKNSLGVELVGLDFTNPTIKAIDDNLKDDSTDAVFPDGFSLGDLPNGLGLVIKGPYRLLDVTYDDGTTRTAILVGAHDADTNPMMTMTYNKDTGDIRWSNTMLGLRLVMNVQPEA